MTKQKAEIERLTNRVRDLKVALRAALRHLERAREKETMRMGLGDLMELDDVINGVRGTLIEDPVYPDAKGSR